MLKVAHFQHITSVFYAGMGGGDMIFSPAESTLGRDWESNYWVNMQQE